jgi:MFS transporter, SP family, general alpha glucoside:H+ symporter
MGHRNSLGPSADKIEAAEFDRLADAQDANSQEHDLKLFDALRLYPKSVFWSVVMSAGVIMDGYDIKLIGTLYAQPAFQKAYGRLVKDDSYQIPAPWQAGLSNGSICGQFVGLLLAGHLSERFGFRKTMLAGLISVIACIFIPFFSPNLAVLEAGQVLFGKTFRCI